MDYQVWIKEEFDERYTKVDCGDLAAAKREIDQAVRRGGEPILTVEVPYELSIKTGEVGKEEKSIISAKEKYRIGIKGDSESEVKKSKSKPDKSPGPESEGEVRPGDAEPVPE